MTDPASVRPAPMAYLELSRHRGRSAARTLDTPAGEHATEGQESWERWNEKFTSCAGWRGTGTGGM